MIARGTEIERWLAFEQSEIYIRIGIRCINYNQQEPGSHWAECLQIANITHTPVDYQRNGMFTRLAPVDSRHDRYAIVS